MRPKLVILILVLAIGLVVDDPIVVVEAVVLEFIVEFPKAGTVEMEVRRPRRGLPARLVWLAAGGATDLRDHLSLTARLPRAAAAARPPGRGAPGRRAGRASLL